MAQTKVVIYSNCDACNEEIDPSSRENRRVFKTLEKSGLSPRLHIHTSGFEYAIDQFDLCEKCYISFGVEKFEDLVTLLLVNRSRK